MASTPRKPRSVNAENERPLITRPNKNLSGSSGSTGKVIKPPNKSMTKTGSFLKESHSGTTTPRKSNNSSSKESLSGTTPVVQRTPKMKRELISVVFPPGRLGIEFQSINGTNNIGCSIFNMKENDLLSGLVVGDRIYEIDGICVHDHTFPDILEELKKKKSSRRTVVFSRSVSGGGMPPTPSSMLSCMKGLPVTPVSLANSEDSDGNSWLPPTPMFEPSIEEDRQNKNKITGEGNNSLCFDNNLDEKDTSRIQSEDDQMTPRSDKEESSVAVDTPSTVEETVHSQKYPQMNQTEEEDDDGIPLERRMKKKQNTLSPVPLIKPLETPGGSKYFMVDKFEIRFNGSEPSEPAPPPPPPPAMTNITTSSRACSTPIVGSASSSQYAPFSASRNGDEASEISDISFREDTPPRSSTSLHKKHISMKSQNQMMKGKGFDQQKRKHHRHHNRKEDESKLSSISKYSAKRSVSSKQSKIKSSKESSLKMVIPTNEMSEASHQEEDFLSFSEATFPGQEEESIDNSSPHKIKKKIPSAAKTSKKKTKSEMCPNQVFDQAVSSSSVFGQTNSSIISQLLSNKKNKSLDLNHTSSYSLQDASMSIKEMSSSLIRLELTEEPNETGLLVTKSNSQLQPFQIPHNTLQVEDEDVVSNYSFVNQSNLDVSFTPSDYAVANAHSHADAIASGKDLSPDQTYSKILASRRREVNKKHRGHEKKVAQEADSMSFGSPVREAMTSNEWLKASEAVNAPLLSARRHTIQGLVHGAPSPESRGLLLENDQEPDHRIKKPISSFPDLDAVTEILQEAKRHTDTLEVFSSARQQIGPFEVSIDCSGDEEDNHDASPHMPAVTSPVSSSDDNTLEESILLQKKGSEDSLGRVPLRQFMPSYSCEFRSGEGCGEGDPSRPLTPMTPDHSSDGFNALEDYRHTDIDDKRDESMMSAAWSLAHSPAKLHSIVPAPAEGSGMTLTTAVATVMRPATAVKAPETKTAFAQMLQAASNAELVCNVKPVQVVCSGERTCAEEEAATVAEHLRYKSDALLKAEANVDRLQAESEMRGQSLARALEDRERLLQALSSAKELAEFNLHEQKVMSAEKENTLTSELTIAREELNLVCDQLNASKAEITELVQFRDRNLELEELMMETQLETESLRSILDSGNQDRAAAAEQQRQALQEALFKTEALELALQESQQKQQFSKDIMEKKQEAEQEVLDLQAECRRLVCCCAERDKEIVMMTQHHLKQLEEVHRAQLSRQETERQALESVSKSKTAREAASPMKNNNASSPISPVPSMSSPSFSTPETATSKRTLFSPNLPTRPPPLWTPQSPRGSSSSMSTNQLFSSAVKRGGLLSEEITERSMERSETSSVGAADESETGSYFVEVEGLNVRIKELELELEKKKIQIEDLESDSSEVEIKYTELLQNIANLSSSNIHLQRDLDQAREVYQVDSTRCGKLQTEIDTMQAEMEEMNNSYQNLEDQFLVANENKKVYAVQNESLLVEVDTLQEEIEEMSSNITQLEEELEEIKQAKLLSCINCEEIQTKLDETRCNFNLLMKELEEAKTEKELHEKQYNKTKQDYEDVLKTSVDQSSMNESLAQDVKTLQSELHNAKKLTMDNLKKQKNELEEMMKINTLKQNKNHEDKVLKLKIELENLTNIKSSFENRLNEDKNHYQKEVKRLESMLDDQKVTAKETLEQTMDEMKHQKHEFETNMSSQEASFRKQIESLQIKIVDLESLNESCNILRSPEALLEAEEYTMKLQFELKTLKQNLNVVTEKLTKLTEQNNIINDKYHEEKKQLTFSMNHNAELLEKHAMKITQLETALFQAESMNDELRNVIAEQESASMEVSLDSHHIVDTNLKTELLEWKERCRVADEATEELATNAEQLANAAMEAEERCNALEAELELTRNMCLELQQSSQSNQQTKGGEEERGEKVSVIVETGQDNEHVCHEYENKIQEMEKHIEILVNKLALVSAQERDHQVVEHKEEDLALLSNLNTFRGEVLAVKKLGLSESNKYLPECIDQLAESTHKIMNIVEKRVVTSKHHRNPICNDNRDNVVRDRVEEIEAKVRTSSFTNTNNTGVSKALASSLNEFDSLHAKTYVGMLNMLSGGGGEMNDNNSTVQFGSTQYAMSPPRTTTPSSPSTPILCFSPATVDALSESSNTLLEASKVVRMELVGALGRVRRGVSLSIRSTLIHSSFKSIMIAFRRWETFSASVALSLRMNKSPRSDGGATRRSRLHGRYLSTTTSLRAILKGEGTQGFVSPPTSQQLDISEGMVITESATKRMSRRSDASSRPTALAARQKRINEASQSDQNVTSPDKDEFWEVSSDDDA